MLGRDGHTAHAEPRDVVNCFAEVFDELAATAPPWTEGLAHAIRARAAMLALLVAAGQAAQEALARGTALAVGEAAVGEAAVGPGIYPLAGAGRAKAQCPALQGGEVHLEANGWRVVFDLTARRTGVRWQRERLPVDFHPTALGQAEIPSADCQALRGWAQQLVAGALRVVLASQ